MGQGLKHLGTSQLSRFEGIRPRYLARLAFEGLTVTFMEYRPGLEGRLRPARAGLARSG